MSDFQFLDVGVLRDDDLELVLVRTADADPEKGYVPAYFFEMKVEGVPAGNLSFRAQTTPLLEQVGGHLGYDVHEAFRGNHLAERSCRLIVPL
ncbi:MAG: tagatose-bisphosphate aldolase, partial [Alphaproteobacteria bacterium CG_4_10_14_0_8_um_filter_53_9]